VDEANPRQAETNCHEAEAKIAISLIFSAKFYILTPFSPKTKNFRSSFDGTSKILTQNGL